MSETPRWELQSVAATGITSRLGEGLLNDGWEPFAVDQGRIWLRRHRREDAKVVVGRPRTTGPIVSVGPRQKVTA